MKLGRHDKDPEQFQVGVERGADGFATAWCVDLPGCCALVPPGGDLAERMSIAILEHTVWSHQRSADRLDVWPSQIQVVQSVTTDSLVGKGQSTSFFVHDGEPPRSNEFPVWANPHDRAVDELRELALSLPGPLQQHRLGAEGRTLIETVHHAAATERAFADQLRAGSGGHTRMVHDPLLRELQEAHTWLQQVVCDVPGDVRVRRDPERGVLEDWSVRKVMRRSIWHLRYHTWELRKAIAGLWVA
jgi:hypothetical protein